MKDPRLQESGFFNCSGDRINAFSPEIPLRVVGVAILGIKTPKPDVSFRRATDPAISV